MGKTLSKFEVCLGFPSPSQGSSVPMDSTLERESFINYVEA